MNQETLMKKIKERLEKGYKPSGKTVEQMIKENYDLAKRRGAKTPAEFEKEIREFAYAGAMSGY